MIFPRVCDSPGSNGKTALRALILTVLFVPGLFGCATLAVDSEWNRDVDFGTYRSYAWIPQDSGPASEQQLANHLDLRLRRVVDDILIDDKGFDRASSIHEADFLLAYYIDTEKKLEVDYAVYGSYYRGYGYGYWRGYYGGPEVNRVREYTTGSLVLDIVDRETKTLLWTGVVAGEAKYENPSGERIQKVMTEMLADFPPN